MDGIAVALSVPDRLLALLAGYGPAGATIETTNRDLAAAAGCSVAAIPGALRMLEADGFIERSTTTQAIRRHPISPPE